MASRGPTSENSDMENANKPASSWPLKQGPKKRSKHDCDKGTLTVATGLGTHKEKKVWVDIHVQAAGSQICLHNMCGQKRNSPMADSIFGSKYGPQNGVQNWITFSFLLLRLCLGPLLGSRFGPKSGVSHRRILLLPAEVLQADLRRTGMSVSVNTCFFSLFVPLCFLYSRGPFLVAMFLLVFWILFWEPWWSRFVGIRGAPRLTEACPRHAWQPQGCCACVGQAVVCRVSSLHLSLLHQKVKKCHRRYTSCAGSQSKSFTWFLCAF